MNPTFKFKNKNFEYFLHRGNSEKRLEIAIASYYIKETYKNNHSVIEWGNVMACNGFEVKHDIVDIVEGPIKEDWEFWQPKRHYDLLVSISSLEHINMGDYNQPKTGIDKLIRIGKRISSIAKSALIILPLHYNLEMDQLILNDKKPFDIYEKTYYTRVDVLNWGEIKKERVGTLGRGYCFPYPYSNEEIVMTWNLD